MNNWPYRPVSDFLVERTGKYKPNDPAISGYKRLEKIDFSGKIHLSYKSTKTIMIIVDPGDLVISGINVAKGALSVYEGTEPVVATIHYSSYMFDRKKIDIDFLKRFLKSPAFITELQNQVKGGIKTEIKPKHLLPLKVRVPDISEQKRVNLYFDSIETEISDLSNEVSKQSSCLTQLRQAILQEAIEGKLTAGLPCRQAGLPAGKAGLPAGKAGWRDRKFRNFSGKIVPKVSHNYFAYVMECDDGSLYKGFSRDLFSRIDRHLEGRGAKWTEKHKPVSLIHFEEFETEKEAIEREKYFKSGSGREWLNSIRVQNKLDYDAEALLEKIKAEKEKLVKEGKIRKQKPLAPIKPEEVLFELPEGWVWTRLGEICKSITDGDHQPPPKQKEGIPFLVISNISSGELDFNNTRYVSEKYFNNLQYERKPLKGDILYTVTGSYGIPILLKESHKFCIQRHIGIIRPMKQIVQSFLVHLLFSPQCKKQADNTAWGVAVKTVSLNSLRNYIVPFPPIVEQQAITDRVEKLLSMVDDLEKQVSERKEHSEQLMQAVLREAFEGDNHA